MNDDRLLAISAKIGNLVDKITVLDINNKELIKEQKRANDLKIIELKLLTGALTKEQVNAMLASLDNNTIKQEEPRRKLFG